MRACERTHVLFTLSVLQDISEKNTQIMRLDAIKYILDVKWDPRRCIGNLTRHHTSHPTQLVLMQLVGTLHTIPEVLTADMRDVITAMYVQNLYDRDIGDAHARAYLFTYQTSGMICALNNRVPDIRDAYNFFCDCNGLLPLFCELAETAPRIAAIRLLVYVTNRWHSATRLYTRLILMLCAAAINSQSFAMDWVLLRCICRTVYSDSAHYFQALSDKVGWLNVRHGYLFARSPLLLAGADHCADGSVHESQARRDTVHDGC
jgi:hypothetical protein